jgi:hypothetical protein
MRETAGGALSGCQGHTAYRMKNPEAFSGPIRMPLHKARRMSALGCYRHLKSLSTSRKPTYEDAFFVTERIGSQREIRL